MNDTEQAQPLQTDTPEAIKQQFQSKLAELISQHDDGSHLAGSSIVDALAEVLRKLSPNVEDRGMSELGL